MDETDKIEREALKYQLKLAVMNNRNFKAAQKRETCVRIDTAAQQADWIVEIIRMCGYTS